ncbi:MAG: hypothetical protein A3J51_04450 [Omnitrophica WOR_2 bacterium RIFCSPHIGHO2_02_FULL_45_21]|nr:MAG: hypothetical protein A3J51_04450 [Omnitrophica WOR_2 bacterium RIFCSPHIGHO2_02_FULL_45_21]
MALLSYFNSVSQAMLQIFLLGLVGFVLVRKKILLSEAVTGLSSFLIGVAFPALIFWQLVTKFSFSLYPDWWIFPLASFIITGLGLCVGFLFSLSVKDARLRREFVSLVGFQNAGYLPLTLLAWIVPGGYRDILLIYLFLFLLGFNLVIWSWGVYFLSASKLKTFSFAGLFSPPVIAILLGFTFVSLKLNSLIPKFILQPIELLGNCSFPLAVVVLGATLAELSNYKPEGSGLPSDRQSHKPEGSGLPSDRQSHRPFEKKTISKLILAKLIVLPSLGLLFVSSFRLPYLLGLLIIMELAVPSANSLAVIARKYPEEEKLISQGIFISHLVSLITLPVFLALFHWIALR